MKNKKIGTSILAFLLAAATAAAGAQPVLAADLGTVTDNVPAIVAASASVSVIDASGDLEAAYAEWGAVSNATGYNVYIKPAGGSYTQLDTMLVRQYPDRFRADAVGLKAGSYTMKIVPVINGKEDASKAAETAGLQVEAHDRSGFGFVEGTSSGAYNEDGTLKADAIQYTNLLNPVRYYKGTHDLGFMINCSYGNAERLAPNDTIKAVMKETADNLCGRFNDSIGAIRSWDFGSWNFPVIIDNMMNLDLLFTVSKWTGDNKYKDIAIKHAVTTMNNHFRPDYTCWHVVSYNNDGTVERKQTHQGKNDDSSWSRGQAWAVYGYTSCYRETNDTTFLNFAVNIADMIMERVKTDDAIPYWDYDAPVTEETPRDASAAAVTAAGFIELSTMVPDGKKYLDYAEKILKSLSSDAYLAKAGENQGFILLHSVGSLPNGSEIDTPLNYADYYYLEALKRFMDLKGINYQNI